MQSAQGKFFEVAQPCGAGVCVLEYDETCSYLHITLCSNLVNSIVCEKYRKVQGTSHMEENVTDSKTLDEDKRMTQLQIKKTSGINTSGFLSFLHVAKLICLWV